MYFVSFHHIYQTYSTFLDSSDRPQIELLNKEQIKVGQNVTLVCLAEGGNPPPRLTWFLGDRAMKSQYEYDFGTQVAIMYITF